MYESFYGLKEKPFNLTPDPDYLYMSPGHENTFSHLEYAIQESKGFVVVTGEVGSGKTTLINYLMRRIPQTFHVGILNNTFVQPQELLRMICQEFELPTEDADKTSMLARFYSYLLEKYAKRERVILIIDEAQNLPDKSLEEIRMLSNLESEKHHLVQMLLVGQPQLREKLQRKRMEQFVQRVTVSCHLDALGKNQVGGYIRHRLAVAGAQKLDLFDPEAIEAIYKHSKGIPRLINTLCDSAFVYGYADDVDVIGHELVDAVALARSLGVPEETPDSFPDEESATDPPKGLFDILQDRMRSLEERLASQEHEIRNLSRELAARSESRDDLETIFTKMFREMKKSFDSRAKLEAQVEVLKDRLAEKQGSSKRASLVSELPLADYKKGGM